MGNSGVTSTVKVFLYISVDRCPNSPYIMKNVEIAIVVVYRKEEEKNFILQVICFF
jgi:hypothetical protein